MTTVGRVLLLLLSMAIASVVLADSSSSSEESLTSLVDTRIGGGGIIGDVGCINPGPQVPYGAMRLGPDTSLGLIPLRAPSSCGYQHIDSFMMCFSHTHLVGAGDTDFQNIGITVVRTEPNETVADLNRFVSAAGYQSKFSHSSEVSVPGYYAVSLDDWNTRAELTVGGTHSGIHRYTCSKGAADGAAKDTRQCTLVVDICHSSWSNVIDMNDACKEARLNSLTLNSIQNNSSSTTSVLTAWVKNHGGFSVPWMGNKSINIYFRAEVEVFGEKSGKNFKVSTNQKNAGGTSGSATGCWLGGKIFEGGINGCNNSVVGINTTSKSLGVLLTVDDEQQEDENIVITVRTSISFISIENTKRLMEDQLVGHTTSKGDESNNSPPSYLSFNETMMRTQNLWEETLSRVQVSTAPSAANALVFSSSHSKRDATAAQAPLTAYYSALYRTHLAPTTYTELGTFLSELDIVTTIPSAPNTTTTTTTPLQEERGGRAYQFMSDLSIWDIYRSEMPLTMILEPLVARNTAWSMMQMYEERGFLPVWVLANVETYCMVGQHSAVILSDFVRKGLKGLNNTAIYDATVSGIRKQNQKMMPPPQYYHAWMFPHQYGSGSDTLDFAIDAAAVRNLALLMGDTEVAEEFQPFAEAWKNVWNPDRNIFCPKTPNGTWVCPSSDWILDVLQKKYREDNAGQYRWYVPQDLEGLVAQWHSKDEYAQSLNDFFVYGQLWPLDALGVPNIFYWAGNEPDMMAPVQFPAAGNEYAWLTDKWVAASLYNYFQPSSTYKGLPGNDDYGTLSAYEFFAFSGFYPISSTNDYVLMTPWFSNISFSVSADGAALSPFVSSQYDPSSSNGTQQKILTIVTHNHPGTETLWRAAGHLDGGNNGSSFFYVANASINGVPLENRTFTQEQLVSYMVTMMEEEGGNGRRSSTFTEGSGAVIEVWLADEPIVFGDALPSQGGRSPFIPKSPLKGGDVMSEEEMSLLRQKAKLSLDQILLKKKSFRNRLGNKRSVPYSSLFRTKEV